MKHFLFVFIFYVLLYAVQTFSVWQLIFLNLQIITKCTECHTITYTLTKRRKRLLYLLIYILGDEVGKELIK